MSETVTFPIRGPLTFENLPDVYVELAKDLPKEGIEHAPKNQTRKGYDTTGYGYQFVVNRLNEVVFGHWRAIHTVVKERIETTSTGKTMNRIVIHMTLQLGNWITGPSGREFEALAEADCYGGHTSLEEESAFKGAYTNAFKKVAAFFGVGKRAFEGLIDEDYRGPGGPEEHQQPRETNTPHITANNKPKNSPTLETIKAKWEVLYGSLEKFDEGYDALIKKKYDHDAIDTYLAKKLVEKNKSNGAA